MKIEFRHITVRDLVKGYINNQEAGVVAYGGKLNVRPPYQREFVYKDAQWDAVIESGLKAYPLNVMYWVINGVDDYEVLDGQQRSISLCEYVLGLFPVGAKQCQRIVKCYARTAIVASRGNDVCLQTLT